MSKRASVAFITLGCPKNEADSDRMAGRVSSRFTVTADPGDADVLVLNTCAFIQSAVEEAIDEILVAVRWRAGRPGRRLIVAGCLPSRYGEDLARELPEVDAFVPVAREGTIADVVAQLLGEAPAPDADIALPRAVPGPTAYLQVSDGCDRRCTYCTIPRIRGAHVSRPYEELMAEARYLIANGVREIVLVGQDITRWGTDLPGSERLPDLVRSIAALDGDFRVRLMYLQPDGVTDSLLAAIATSEKVCRYLDVPIQHASSTILRAMGRRGDAAALLALVERIRSTLPDAVLRTTVMAGFPGEERAHIEELARFLERARFDYVGVFAFSPEEGTEAASLPNQVPARTRVARAQRIRDLADAIGVAQAASWVGRTAQVLVEGEEDGMVAGRTCGQAPEIDGVTLFTGTAARGTFITVRVVDSHGYDLIAEVCR